MFVSGINTEVFVSGISTEVFVSFKCNTTGVTSGAGLGSPS